MPTISSQLHPQENLQRPSHTRTNSPSTSYKKKHPSPVLHTFAEPSASSTASPSRYPLTRPLSPDLPVRDALYLFSNFSSYMRSPHEGAEGIVSSEDFRDTIRLLDFARHYASTPGHNVHVLHLKYRFQSRAQVFRSPYASGDYILPMNYRDSTGRLRNPVPQPFATLSDPVVKVDYKENGVFEPLPPEAIFRHIATVCQPPPRIIVISYVSSQVTQNHIAALSTWALATSPPAYIFSPLETRIRENQCLPISLHHAIPMSMYASPPPNTPGTSPTSVQRAIASHGSLGSDKYNRERRLSAPCISSTLARSILPFNPPELVRHDSQVEKQYPPAPVASLTVTPDSAILASSADSATVPPPPGERVPLWALAPGVGIVHGSTSASIGIRLGDFSAVNLTDPTDGSRPKSTSMPSALHAPRGLVQPSMDFQTTKRPTTSLVAISNSAQKYVPPVEAPVRPITPSKALIPGMSKPFTSATGAKEAQAPVREAPTIHLTPPDKAVGKLIEAAPASWEESRSAGTQSWPDPVNKPTGWKRGGKEKMEDILDGLEMLDVLPEDAIDEVTKKLEAVLGGEEDHLMEIEVPAGCKELLALL